MGSYNCREVRRGYAFIQNVIPYDIFEERLPLDFLRVPLSRTEATARVPGEKLRMVNA
jgi:hypothetical protein